MSRIRFCLSVFLYVGLIPFVIYMLGGMRAGYIKNVESMTSGTLERLDKHYSESGTVELSKVKGLIRIADDPGGALIYIDGLIVLCIIFTIVISGYVFFSEVRYRRLLRKYQQSDSS